MAVGPGDNYHSGSEYTWPLGCLFSEAAIWVSGGYAALLNYRKARNSKYNAETLHGIVMGYQDAALATLCDSDTITDKVLGLIKGEMLAIDCIHRSPADIIWLKCQDILSIGKIKATPVSNEGRLSPPTFTDLYDTENMPEESSRKARPSIRSVKATGNSSPPLSDKQSKEDEEVLPYLSWEPTTPAKRLERANPKSLFRRLFRRGGATKEAPEAPSENPYVVLTTDSEIRLLILLPGTLEEPIKITLSTADIQADSCPEYDALTYAWGDQFYVKEVFVNGQEHPVTKNLYEALGYLRDRTVPRVLWIDAICINMSDMEERSHQIQLMRVVFQLSRRVLIWLGPEKEDSAWALKTLEEINYKLQIDWTSGTVKAASGISTDSTDWTDQASDISFESGSFLAITRLLQRPLFSRVWAWQEIHLASKESLVIAGHDYIFLEHFRNAIWYLAWKRIYDSKSRAHVRESLLTVLAMVGKVADRSLRSLIDSTRHCHCSDSRDRIYALLALTETPTLSRAQLFEVRATGVYGSNTATHF